MQPQPERPTPTAPSSASSLFAADLLSDGDRLIVTARGEVAASTVLTMVAALAQAIVDLTGMDCTDPEGVGLLLQARRLLRRQGQHLFVRSPAANERLLIACQLLDPAPFIDRAGAGVGPTSATGGPSTRPRAVSGCRGSRRVLLPDKERSDRGRRAAAVVDRTRRYVDEQRRAPHRGRAENGGRWPLQLAATAEVQSAFQVAAESRASAVPGHPRVDEHGHRRGGIAREAGHDTPKRILGDDVRPSAKWRIVIRLQPLSRASESKAVVKDAGGRPCAAAGLRLMRVKATAAGAGCPLCGAVPSAAVLVRVSTVAMTMTAVPGARLVMVAPPAIRSETVFTVLMIGPPWGNC